MMVRLIGLIMVLDPEKIVLAGLHLAGSNSNRTALVILNYSPREQKLIIKRVYEKIGSYGRLYSDDRLLKILAFEGEPHALIVDTPLSVPPCVRCVRPTCPGVNSCDDVEVAFLLSKSRVFNSRKKGRKVRPINPQCHRISDIDQMIKSWPQIIEPSYSSNLAPLVIRGQILQKRLRAEYPQLTLQETSIALSLQEYERKLEEKDGNWVKYHDFYRGPEIRRSVFQLLLEKWFSPQSDAEDLKIKIVSDISLFNAFICSLNAYFFWLERLKRHAFEANQEKEYLFVPSISEVRQ